MHEFSRLAHRYVRARQLFFTLLFAAGLVSVISSDSFAQSKANPKKRSTKTPKEQPKPAAPAMPNYYRIVGLGSAEPDSTVLTRFPYPMAVLHLLDTSKYQVRVRFPAVGLLGAWEDTAQMPTFAMADSVYAYRSSTQLFRIKQPSTPYLVIVDVFDKRTGKAIESRPLPYEMNVKKYEGAALQRIYEPTAGLSDLLLQRPFSPGLMPLTISTNPGWMAEEILDTSGTYALNFKLPSNPAASILSLTMRPTGTNKFDSATWTSFKDRARIAFGSEGIAVSSIADFDVEDSLSRGVIYGGYEFLSKRPEGGVDYVATFMTPRAILLLMAPMADDDSPAKLSFIRSIARSLKVRRGELTSTK